MRAPRSSFRRRFAAVEKVTGGSKMAQRELTIDPRKISKKGTDVGVIVLNVGMVLSLTGLAMTDVLYLRSLSLVGSVCGIYYNYTRKPKPLKEAILWSCAFISLNAFMIVKILIEKQPVQFAQEDFEVYKSQFLKHGIAPRQFLRIMNISERKRFKPGELLHAQDDPVTCLTILCKGKCSILVNGERVTEIYGNQSGNSLLGAIAALHTIQREQTAKHTKEDEHEISVPGCAGDVLAETDVEAWVVPIDSLMSLIHDDSALLVPLTTSFSAAVTTRLKRKNEGIHFDNYVELLKVVSADDRIEPDEKRALRRYRQRHGISKEEHASALRAIGWSQEEYVDGALHKDFSLERGVKSVERRLRHLGLLASYDEIEAEEEAATKANEAPGNSIKRNKVQRRASHAYQV